MYDFKKVEQEVGRYWKDHKIFEKSLEKTQKGKRFVFWEGPPTANGLPHTGHFLTRIYKDLYGRYKTMRGFFVLRKAGWDTHGLPVEIEIEKELGFKNKKEIEEYGIAKFNRKARESVLKYKGQWEEMSRRMGFWLDLDNPYITYETPYMESVWNILSEISKRGLLYQGHKVIPYCTRCGTGLSAHEVAQGYKKVTDTSVYVKFKIVGQENTFIVAWTTTPWTLPGNVALAVGANVKYIYAKKEREIWIVAADLADKALGAGTYGIDREVMGSDLVGLEYEPLFDIAELKSPQSYKVYDADFVSTLEGTGVVHTAVMYGEDDYNLGTKLNLPKVHTVDLQGKFLESVGPDLAGKYVKAKTTDDFIIQYLKDKNLLFKSEPHDHDYPFCWRCGTPLLYYAKNSWFIKTSAINKELVANNDTVNWIPEHVRQGRFGQWLAEGKDWALSRERYWGTPLPIWECQKCDNKVTIGSIKELEKLSQGTKNTYYVMRHGGTTRHEGTTDIISNTHLDQDHYSLTAAGRAQIESNLQILQLEKVDAIYASPFKRTTETAEIASKILHCKFEIDDRIREKEDSLELEGKNIQYGTFGDQSESQSSIRMRMMSFMADMEKKYKNKTILIITHGAPLKDLQVIGDGLTRDQVNKLDDFSTHMPDLGMPIKLNWRKIPRNEYGELDLHRPFIDEVVFKCSKCRSKMKKIPDLIDVWFDSGAMPYAQWHYPFENKDIFKKQYPADFIVEGMDQTRGWFYTLLAISTLLGNGAPYRNVMALGFTLDEKGVKESKSKGNFIPVPELMDKYGVDILRWYFASTMTAGENKSVIGREIEEKLKGFFFTLQNCIRFYELYADKEIVEVGKLSQLDKWLLSRFNNLLQSVTEKLDVYNVTAAGREIEQFVVEDLSNWWVRRSRKRKEALPLLRLILLDLARVLAPFTPFMAEDIFRRMAGPGESVHLLEWPKVSKKYIDEKLETEMAAARDVIARGLGQRKEKQMKVRQPLADVTVKRDKFSRDIESLIKDELNVKKVIYDKSKPDEVSLNFDLTPALLREGYAREAVRTIQEMRKEAKYRMDDEVMVHWHTFDDEIVAAMEKWTEEIKKDTVLKILERHRKDGMAYDIERESELASGKKIWLAIKK